MWTLIDKISEKPQNNAASKVRMLDGSQPSSKTELISDWGKYFCKLLKNKSLKVKQSTFQNQAQTSPFQQQVQRERMW